jgi:hypothetical protein
VGGIPDNLKKLTQDSITEAGCVWIDDTYCLPRTQRVLIDADNPRLEVVLSVAEYIGIFDNENCFNEFINTYCKQCKRYSNNCSILNKALEGRIQKDVEGFKCLKFNGVKK